ncbi:MAG: hypothetical protein ACE5GM_10275, partial [bacterium]
PLKRRSIPFNPLYLVKTATMAPPRKKRAVKPVKPEKIVRKPARSPAVKSVSRLSVKTRAISRIKRKRLSVRPVPSPKQVTVAKHRPIERKRSSRKLTARRISPPRAAVGLSAKPQKAFLPKPVRARRVLEFSAQAIRTKDSTFRIAGIQKIKPKPERLPIPKTWKKNAEENQGISVTFKPLAQPGEPAQTREGHITPALISLKQKGRQRLLPPRGKALKWGKTALKKKKKTISSVMLKTEPIVSPANQPEVSRKKPDHRISRPDTSLSRESLLPEAVSSLVSPRVASGKKEVAADFPEAVPLNPAEPKPAPDKFLSPKVKPVPQRDAGNTRFFMRTNVKADLAGFKKKTDFHHIFTKIPRRREVWISYLNNQLSEAGFIYSMGLDRKGNLWITSNQGISRFDGRHWRHFNSESGLPADRVYSLAVAEDNTRWFGSDSGLLVDRGEGIKQVAGTADLRIFDLKRENPDKLWLATDTGLFSYRIRENKISFYPSPEEGLVIYSLAFLAGGGLLVGTDRGLYQQRKGTWSLCLTTKDPVDTVAVDSYQRFWYGTESGGGRYDGKKWVKLPGSSKEKTVYKLLKSREGGVWVGTAGGAGYYRHGRWKYYGRENGLLGKEVYAMTTNKRGVWWFATDKGISQLTVNY